MKKILFIIIYGIGQIAMANQTFPKVMYNMQLRAHNISCEARLNGLYLYFTKGVPKLLSMGQQISEYMDEGDNIISFKAMNISEAVELDDIANSYCELTISSYTLNEATGKLEDKVLSHIRYTYVSDGKEYDDYPRYLLSSETSKSLDLLNIKRLEDSHLKNLSDPVQNIVASQNIKVDVYRPFRWIHESTPLTNSPENKQMVWEAYNQMRQAVNREDRNFFKDMARIGTEDVSNFQGDTFDNHFNFGFDFLVKKLFDLNKNIWKPDYGTIDDYELELYAGGKMFRMVRKNNTVASPLRWKFEGYNETQLYNPILTYIDGKIVMAVF